MNRKNQTKARAALCGAAAAAVLLSCTGADDPANPPVNESGLRIQLQALVDGRSIPGAVALIADRDGVVEDLVVGYRDVAEAKPMTEDTIFRLYSMSKPITSVAIMMLVERGDIALDTPALTVLPEFQDMRVYESGGLDDMVTVPVARPITIRDLLLHEAGITYHFTGTTPVHAYYRKYGVMRDTPVGRTPDDGPPARSLDELVERLGDAPMLHQPGEEFAYSYSTTVLGAVIERVSGQTLDLFLQENLFDPLMMADTTFFIDDQDLDRFVTNYMMTDEGMTEIESPEESDYRDHSRLLDGGGAIAGTAADYLRFARMLANGGVLDGVRILSEDSVRLMFEPHTVIEGLGMTTQFGYGFAIADDEPVEGAMMPPGTVGWSGSGNTFFSIDPESGNVVVFMTQVITPGEHYDLARRFRKIVNDAAMEVLGQ